MGSTSVDDLLANFGDPGSYQIKVLAMLWFSMFILSLNNMMSIFTMGLYPHHCQLPDGAFKNESLPRAENGDYASCSMYVDPSNHSLGTMSCDNGWEYYTLNGEWSIVQEWDLVCDKHYQSALATSVYFAGVTIGCGVFGYLADKIGRKPVILCCLYGYVILGISTAFANSYLLYAVLRFFSGLILQGATGTAYIMCVELFLPHRRNLVAIITQTQWPLMLLLLTGLNYFVKNWRTFQLIISVPFAVTIVYIWFLPESPRWLIAMNKVEQAKKELRRFAKCNNLPIMPNLGTEITRAIERNAEKRVIKEQVYGITDLFAKKNMIIISTSSCYFFFTGCFAFYAIAYSMATIGSNIHLSYCVTSLIDLTIIITMYFVLNRIGRKTAGIAAMAFCSGICFLVVFLLIILPANDTNKLSTTIVAGLGRASLAAYFSSMPIYVSEMSPTVIRTLLSGVANLWGRIGGIVAPQVMLLEIYVWKPLPFLLCAFMCLAAVLVLFLLPETKNKPLPEVPEDVDKLWKKKHVHFMNEKPIKQCEMTQPLNDS